MVCKASWLYTIRTTEGFYLNGAIPDAPEQKGYTAWGAFKEDTKYFQPSQKDYMINLRVENLEELIEQLEKEGVQVVGEIEKYEYGNFGWIIDPEGNKIELWEPVDNEFTKMYEGKTIH